MADLKRKTNIVFLKIVGIGLLFSAIFVSLAVLLYSRWSLILASLDNGLETLCGCTNHLSLSSHPWIFSFLFVVGTGLVIFFSVALFKAFRLKKLTDRFIKANLDNQKDSLSNKLEKIVDSLNLKRRIVEINNDSLTVFCFGLIRPKICISSALVEKLSDQELKAVLLHEQYHLITNEVMRLFIIKTITSVLLFVPGLKSLSRQYFKLSEVAADKWSIDNSQDKMPLAGAIYKILKLKERAALEGNLAVAYFNYVTEERVERIVDDNYNLSIKIIKPNLLFKIFLLLVVISFSFFFVYSSKSALASHNEATCSSMHSNMHEECEMLYNESVCEMDSKNYLLNKTACSKLGYSSIK